ncbi:hypothetical protein PsorP6_009757 [Peronosclerospora sorghi]|uniref:Uncharacterized protein n=1 Tax=Peronosclerospora sorghi TaxID=230839 RepID=A0ACC0W1T0_9STRA|nr:hypothetical protein PsorP6_009757 [Peronosclerospora sorghi]
MKANVKHLRTGFDILCRWSSTLDREVRVLAWHVNFLGPTISIEGLEVNRKKALAIEMWKTPTTLKEM